VLVGSVVDDEFDHNLKMRSWAAPRNAPKFSIVP
jgi:hypothetical protein